MMTPFARSLILLSAFGFVLGACASSGARLPTQHEELAKLTADCEARGGFLVPAGQVTGREPLDNYCRIVSGPSERLRPRQ